MTHKYIRTQEVVAWYRRKDGSYAVKYADGYINTAKAFDELTAALKAQPNPDVSATPCTISN